MRPYLELIRVYLVPTALADSWAGFFIYRFLDAVSNEMDPTPVCLGTLALLGLLSASAYSFGMVTNDLFDVRKDTNTGVPRPLATRQVTTRAAIALAIGLGTIALVSGYVLEVPWFTVALLGTVLAYNAGGKKILGIGSLLMGSCRSLNFLTGAAAFSGAGLSILMDHERVLVLPALAIGAYIAIVTTISLQEDRPYNRTALLAASVPLLAIAAVIAGWASILSGWIAWINAVALAACILPALRLPRPESLAPNAVHPAALVVRHALGAIYFVDASLLLCFGQRDAALALYVLFALGWTLKRWWLKSRSSKRSGTAMA